MQILLQKTSWQYITYSDQNQPSFYVGNDLAVGFAVNTEVDTSNIHSWAKPALVQRLQPSDNT